MTVVSNICCCVVQQYDIKVLINLQSTKMNIYIYLGTGSLSRLSSSLSRQLKKNVITNKLKLFY